MALLVTKVNLPAPRRSLVSRPRLIGRLPRESDPLPRLLLVSAPAGFGKTTLLGQWLRAWRAGGGGGVDSRRVAWLSLDAEDADPRRFLVHLVAAVRTAVPDREDEWAETVLNERLSLPTALAGLVNELGDLAGSLVIALDDYHLIDSAVVHEAVGSLLDRLPGNVALALTTRADPPLPLARLRTRGELAEIRAADLRFTAAEATSFFNEAMGLEVTPDHVQALERRTEGWAAGLQLAGLSLRSREEAGDRDAFVAAFSGSHRFVLDYLVEEVLDGQSATVRRFLADTSILDRLTGPLCDALTGRADGSATLEALERANLFVVPLDDQRCWYRYHHLFADVLRSRLLADQPERVAGLHGSAARWYADHDFLDEAIGHSVAGGDAEYAARLVERALPEASRQRQDRTIRRWMASLPDGVVRASPVLNVAAAWCRLGDRDVDEADVRLREAATTLAGMSADEPADGRRSEQLRQLPRTIAMYQAAVAQARGDAVGTMANAQRMLDLAGPEDHFAHGAGGGLLGLGLWARGELVPAADTFGRAMGSLRAAGNVTDELGGTVVLAQLWWARGRPDQAERLLADALAAARERPAIGLPVTGDLLVGLAEALRERDELVGAAEQLAAARELGEIATLPENRYRWYLAMAGLRRAQGDLDIAAQLLDQAQTRYLPGVFPDVRPIPALRARINIARGRFDLVRDWAGEVGVSADDELSYASECNHLTLVRLLIGSGGSLRRVHPVKPGPVSADARSVESVRSAIALLERLLAAAEDGDRGGSVVEILLLQALAQQVLAAQTGADLDAAVTPLIRALELGVPVGYRRLFLDEGPPMMTLLDELRRRGLARDLVAELRTEVPVAPVAAAGRTLADPLSERELEVLRLLATELTGPQIAGRLFVSVNTLRTHTRHIFTKLDVSTRAAAVRRSRDLGLI